VTGRRPFGRAGLLLLVWLASAAFLAACSSVDAGNRDPVPSASSSMPPASEAPAPRPSLDPSRPAKDNLAYFDFTVKAVLHKNAAASGAEVIDALAAAGFDRADMQVTPDRTTADLEAGSIQFAVRFNGECLIGQRGPEDGGYHSMVGPLLGTGRCLLGPAAK
jgi:hypothetical protein